MVERMAVVGWVMNEDEGVPAHGRKQALNQHCRTVLGLPEKFGSSMWLRL